MDDGVPVYDTPSLKKYTLKIHTVESDKFPFELVAEKPVWGTETGGETRTLVASLVENESCMSVCAATR